MPNRALSSSLENLSRSVTPYPMYHRHLIAMESLRVFNFDSPDFASIQHYTAYTGGIELPSYFQFSELLPSTFHSGDSARFSTSTSIQHVPQIAESAHHLEITYKIKHTDVIVSKCS